MIITAFNAEWHYGRHPENPYEAYFAGGITLVEGSEKFGALFTWIPGVQGLSWQLYKEKEPAAEKVECCNKKGIEAITWLFQKIQEYYYLVPKELKTNFHTEIIIELQKIMIDAHLWKLRVDLWRAVDVMLIIPPEIDEQ